jgi:hypothetical protein
LQRGGCNVEDEEVVGAGAVPRGTGRRPRRPPPPPPGTWEGARRPSF